MQGDALALWNHSALLYTSCREPWLSVASPDHESSFNYLKRSDCPHSLRTLTAQQQTAPSVSYLVALYCITPSSDSEWSPDGQAPQSGVGKAVGGTNMIPHSITTAKPLERYLPAS